jgi:hypothetical protein
MNKLQTTIYVVALVAVCSVLATFAFAAPTAPTALTSLESSSRNLSTLAPQTADARGGNVTELNIQALTITQHWQGYYGNVSGNITLQDGNNNTFYNWVMTTVSGEVFATRVSSVNWATVNCTNATNRTNEETYLSMVAGDADSVTNTYSTTTHPAITVGSQSIITNTCFATNGYVNNASQASNFKMLLLSPVSGDIIYTTILNDNSYDFELLVGENEETTIGVTPYYFWVELS